MQNKKDEHTIYTDTLFQINIAQSTFNDKKYHIFLILDPRNAKILTHRIFTDNEGVRLAQNIYNFTLFGLTK